MSIPPLYGLLMVMWHFIKTGCGLTHRSHRLPLKNLCDHRDERSKQTLGGPKQWWCSGSRGGRGCSSPPTEFSPLQLETRLWRKGWREKRCEWGEEEVARSPRAWCLVHPLNVTCHQGVAMLDADKREKTVKRAWGPRPCDASMVLVASRSSWWWHNVKGAQPTSVTLTSYHRCSMVAEYP